MASETSEAGTASGPSLRIEALHIEKLRAIRRLDWPGDGPGWGGSVPEMVLVGGANGSGKTTLLEFLVGAWAMLGARNDASLLRDNPDLMPYKWWTDEPSAGAWVDFNIHSHETGPATVRFVIGDNRFVEANHSPACYGFVLHGDNIRRIEPASGAIIDISTLLDRLKFTRSSLPSLLYIPSKARNLSVLETPLKKAGKRVREDRFLYRWESPKNWDESLEALLYSARWEDLNAKEEGRPQDAHHFDNFARAYEAFFGPDKRLTWHKGELFVEIVETGALHDLSGLSSGEQQIIVLVSELLDRWRPGSLILTDEPELHLHVSWQYALWDALKRWRAERGGQVIATTQSSELFGYSEPGTNVILGSRAP